MNDKNKILKFQIFSIILSLILGILLHSTYKWFNKNTFIATFSAINESTWEHLKLVFFPMLLSTIIGYFYIGKTVPNFLFSKTIGILTSIIFIVTFFYTYTGILGFNIAFLDIGSFFVAVILGEYVAYKLLTSNLSWNEDISLIILIVLLFCFVIFSFFTPKIGIFQDPITLKYGIL